MSTRDLVHKTFVGDRALAEQYVGLAKSLLWGFKEVQNGLPGRRTWSFKNGLRITVASIEGGDFITIDTQSVKKPCTPVSAELYGLIGEPVINGTNGGQSAGYVFIGDQHYSVLKPIDVSPLYKVYNKNASQLRLGLDPGTTFSSYSKRFIDTCQNVGPWYTELKWGNLDWVGPVDPVLKRRIIISWTGPTFRSGTFNSTLTGDFAGLDVYSQGFILGRVPASYKVRGAAVKYDGADRYLYVMASGAALGAPNMSGFYPQYPYEDVLLRRKLQGFPLTKDNTDQDLLDMTHPLGWEVLATFGATTTTGWQEWATFNPAWFFNESCTEAVTMRYVQQDADPFARSSAPLVVSVAGLTKTLQTGALGYRSYDDERTTTVDTPGGGVTDITVTGTQSWDASQTLAADYQGDTLVYLTASEIMDGAADYFDHTDIGSPPASTGYGDGTATRDISMQLKIDGVTVVSFSASMTESYSYTVYDPDTGDGIPVFPDFSGTRTISNYYVKLGYIDLRYNMITYSALLHEAEYDFVTYENSPFAGQYQIALEPSSGSDTGLCRIISDELNTTITFSSGSLAQIELWNQYHTHYAGSPPSPSDGTTTYDYDGDASIFAIPAGTGRTGMQNVDPGYEGSTSMTTIIDHIRATRFYGTTYPDPKRTIMTFGPPTPLTPGGFDYGSFLGGITSTYETHLTDAELRDLLGLSTILYISFDSPGVV